MRRGGPRWIACHGFDRVYRERVAEAEALATAQRAALAEEERERGEEWWDLLVHDKVLGALRLATLPAAAALDASRRLAAEALEVLGAKLSRAEDSPTVGLADGPGPAAGDGVSSLAERLVRIAVELELDPIVSAAGTRAPAVVEDAFCASAEAALVNVARHSGATEVGLEIDTGRDHVRVVVRDTGRGFDPRRPAPDRQGTRRSIPGHVEAVGGRAVVESAPGQGTSVTLSWRSPDRSRVPLPSFVGAAELRWFGWLNLAWVATFAVHLSPHLGSGDPVWAAVVGLALSLTGHLWASLTGFTAPGRPVVALVGSGLVLASAALPFHPTADGSYSLHAMTMTTICGIAAAGQVGPALTLAGIELGTAAATIALRHPSAGALMVPVSGGVVIWTTIIVLALRVYRDQQVEVDASVARRRELAMTQLRAAARRRSGTRRRAVLDSVATPHLRRIAGLAAGRR